MTAEQALVRMIDLCNRGEYCTYELREKMRRRGLSPADSDKIIALLERDRLVDDARYARVTARSKLLYNQWGRAKISLFLRARRIARGDIEAALAALDEEEYLATLGRVVDSKMRRLGEEALTFEGRGKVYRHAMSKGFESPLIVRAIKQWANNSD